MSEKTEYSQRETATKISIPRIWGAVLTHGALCAARYARDLFTPLCKITVSFPVLYSCEVFFSLTQGQTHSAIKMIMSEGEVLCGLFGLQTAKMTCGQTKSRNADFHKLCCPQITIAVIKSKDYKMDVAFSMHGELTNM